MEFPAHRFGTYEEIMKYCARCKKKKSLFCWLRPYGDRDTIKLLSWRQGWNWTVLLVTWLPLSNDNLGFNQKEPLSAWLIEKSRTGTPHSQGRASLFAHFVNSLSTCSLTDNSIKKIILYIGLYVFIAYKLLNRKCPPPTFFDVFFRLKLDCEPHHIKKTHHIRSTSRDAQKKPINLATEFYHQLLSDYARSQIHACVRTLARALLCARSQGRVDFHSAVHAHRGVRARSWRCYTGICMGIVPVEWS